MPTDLVIIIGAGGHSKVVIDAILCSGVAPEAIRVVDGSPEKVGQTILGKEIAAESDRRPQGYRFHVAIGDCGSRQQVHRRHVASGGRPYTVIHPDATISPCCTVAPGAFIAAQAVVGPSAVLGSGVIVNHGAVVDHDCVVGEFAHIAPNATLGGTVKVGARSMVGAGATILPGVVIGDDAVIGAGAVVLRNVEPGQTYVGVPAIRKRKLK